MALRHISGAMAPPDQRNGGFSTAISFTDEELSSLATPAVS